MEYASTSDVSAPGLCPAFALAMMMVRASAGHSVFDYLLALAGDTSPASARYRSPYVRPVATASLRNKFDLLVGVSQSIKLASEIVDWSASLWTNRKRLAVAS